MISLDPDLLVRFHAYDNPNPSDLATRLIADTTVVPAMRRLGTRQRVGLSRGKIKDLITVDYRVILAGERRLEYVGLLMPFCALWN